MKPIVCVNCSASAWEFKNGLRICKYCGTSYTIDAAERTVKKSEIMLDGDVARLLKKCEADPGNARKYANLILDIDPTNEKAKKYL